MCELCQYIREWDICPVLLTPVLIQQHVLIPHLQYQELFCSV